MRLLVTASRAWPFPRVIDRVLTTYHGVVPVTTLVHGSARGGDRRADLWARRHGVSTERWPVTPEDWERHGRGAGLARNAAMVNAGADLCVGFITTCRMPRCPRSRLPHPTHGAADAVGHAVDAGIPTRVFYAHDPEPMVRQHQGSGPGHAMDYHPTLAAYVCELCRCRITPIGSEGQPHVA